MGLRFRAPIRPLRGHWWPALERRFGRYCWADPRVMLDDDASPEAFRAAMSAVWVGNTFKITGSDRHGDADSLLIDNVDLTEADIVDIGASDGSTAVDLIRRCGPFRSYTVADLYLRISASEVRGRVLFWDADGTLILIAGANWLAWPSMSRWVGWLTAPFAWSSERTTERREVLLLNPAFRRLLAVDPRVGHRVHDIFTPWDGPAPDVIKVANLLRQLYFGDAQIESALRLLHGSLATGGHLLIVDNARAAGVAPKAGLYRRSGDHFEVVARTPAVPEIDHLVTRLRAPVDAQPQQVATDPTPYPSN